MDATPLHLLTGFLGSGKTTLLASLLNDPGGERLAVLVNEAAGLPIDQHLLACVDEDVLALPSGCLCCVRRGDLMEALGRLLDRRPDRVLVETTGLADPSPVIHALATDPRLADRARLAGVWAVVDAGRTEELLVAGSEAVRQVELADRIVLSHGDRWPERLPTAREALERWAPGCEVVESHAGPVDREWLFDAPPLGRLRDADAARRFLHAGATVPGSPVATAGRGLPARAPITTHVLETSEPADPVALQLWLQLVAQLDGPRLLRIKILAEDQDGVLHVLQSAGGSVSPRRILGRRPVGVHGVSAVIIARGLASAVVARLLESLSEAARGARSDTL